jgi:lipoyl(octanoyl) transferase
MPLTVLNLLSEGAIAYADALERQRDLVRARQQGEIGDTLLLLEHPPTVTYGKTTDEYGPRGIERIETDRGGDATYHGPGQLVGYPIIHLGEGSRDIHRYVRSLEAALISAIAEFDVVATRAPWHAGVWVGDGYLAALGVKVSRWVTHHGFALNVTPEVQSGFATILPCGVSGKTVVSLSELAGMPINVAAAAEVVSGAFVRQFSDDPGKLQSFA